VVVLGGACSAHHRTGEVIPEHETKTSRLSNVRKPTTHVGGFDGGCGRSRADRIRARARNLDTVLVKEQGSAAEIKSNSPTSPQLVPAPDTVANQAGNGVGVCVGTLILVFPNVPRLRDLHRPLVPVEEEDRCLPPQVGGVEERRDARRAVHPCNDDPITIGDHPYGDVVTNDTRGAECKRVCESHSRTSSVWGSEGRGDMKSLTD